MPEVHYRLRWPDGHISRCYSPSSTIQTSLPAGSEYPLAEFLPRLRAALEYASERVRQKYGHGCAHAAIQIASIEQTAGRYRQDASAMVQVIDYEG